MSQQTQLQITSLHHKKKFFFFTVKTVAEKKRNGLFFTVDNG